MFETQIARGVALLDEKVPGWLDRIVVDKLDLVAGEFPAPADEPDFGRPGCGCVLAQLDDAGDGDGGDYLRFAKRLALHVDPGDGGPHASTFGFTLASHELTSPLAMDHFDALTAEWKATILRLRSERAQVPLEDPDDALNGVDVPSEGVK